MLQQPFEIIGYWDDEIFFMFNSKLIRLKKRLPKEDLILKLKVEPEDVKALRDEILWDASHKPLDYNRVEELIGRQ